MEELTPTEKLIVDEFRSLQVAGHGDITIELSVKDGSLVKLWKTEKKELSTAIRLLREKEVQDGRNNDRDLCGVSESKGQEGQANNG